MTDFKNTSGRGQKEKLKKTKKFSPSSQRWLQRQLNDPYVAEAQAAGFRSRAAFKLQQLDEKFHLLKAGQRVVDLGAAPGGWVQVALKKVGPKGHVVGIDILPMDPIKGAILIESDFTEDKALELLAEACGPGKLDVVLSDIAAGTTGHARTDHIRIMMLAELALDFAINNLKPGGSFVCKLFQGGAEKEYNELLKKNFKTVKNAKPAASRADSRESYIVATGFKG
ncbi:MAG: RlmE family RNA methyltransferase [Bdellovibrionales bacterium]